MQTILRKHLKTVTINRSLWQILHLYQPQESFKQADVFWLSDPVKGNTPAGSESWTIWAPLPISRSAPKSDWHHVVRNTGLQAEGGYLFSTDCHSFSRCFKATCMTETSWNGFLSKLITFRDLVCELWKVKKVFSGRFSSVAPSVTCLLAAFGSSVLSWKILVLAVFLSKYFQYLHEITAVKWPYEFKYRLICLCA